MYENWTEVLTFTPSNGTITNIDNTNKTVSYSGSGRWTGVYIKLLDENNSFKIRTRYKGSQLYIGIIDWQMGGWNVSLEIEDIKIFKNKKEDSELDLVPNKMILNNVDTSILINETVNQYISCEVGSMESLQYISDTPQLISFNEGKLNTIAIGDAKFHVVNKYGIGQR